MKTFLRNTIFVGAFIAVGLVQAAAEPSKFADFAVNAAHARNFMRCDAAIREVHEFAAGAEMRTYTYVYPNSLRIVSIFGDASDFIHIDSTYMPSGNKCTYSKSIMFIVNKSCVAELASATAFKYEREVAGVIHAQSRGGVNMFMAPAGPSSCIKTFVSDGEK